jgi:hypothetical protein
VQTTVPAGFVSTPAAGAISSTSTNVSFDDVESAEDDRLLDVLL